jgi:PST family polysaccharide transporter
MNLIPAFVYRRIAHRPNLVKIVENIGWLFFDKLLRMGVGLFVGVWIARYLGPEQFGQFSFAQALVGLFAAIAGMGLKEIVVRELVQRPDNSGATMGTAFALQIAGSVTAVVLAAGTIIWLRPEDPVTQWLVWLLSFTLVAQSTDVVRYWFEAQVRSRYVVWVENGATLGSAALKVTMILTQAPLVAFAAVLLGESVLIGIGLLWIHVKRGNQQSRWEVRWNRAKALMQDAWPLILSSIAAKVYMRTDQIMLGEMLGEESVGIYAAALKISEVWYMIPGVISASLFPAMLEAKKTDSALYEKRVQQLLDALVWSAIVISLLITLLADWVILTLYGVAYAEAAVVLTIHIWASVFVFMGVGGNKWYVAENLERLMLQRILGGAFINLTCNWFLIQTHGIKGAAFATLLAQASSAFLLDMQHTKSRKLFLLKFKTLYPKFIYR